MSFFAYIDRVLRGLPTSDSIELIRAKEYRAPSTIDHSNLGYDISYKPVDSFMFGAIAAKATKSDLLSSRQLETEAKKLYNFSQDSDNE